MYDQILKFKGTWRTYQARVLKRFLEYKKDGKVHIVAAPGSGKTTLGIELIRLMDEACIVLAPSITIREQWVERIEEAFLLEGIKSEDVLSQNLKDMKLITVSTYQAMHSAMVHYKGQLCDDGDEETTREEDVDYETFDLISAIKEHKVKTICLDECHHLRNEWWKSLEKFQKETALDYTIALTATPPYDSTPDMWTRYMKVCGDIDEEITVPELVKDANLCPHQDYVYFNYPTKEELAKIDEFKETRDEYCKKLLEDKEFESIILSHSCLQRGASSDELLENPAYLSSILIYLNATNHTIPGNLKKLLGYVRLEKISPKWFEILLQGVLYDDCKSYFIEETVLKKYRAELKVRGLLENRRVAMQLKNSLKKDLVRSVGKCESIKDITFHEYKSLDNDLRLLILCDYIKKEYKTSVGNLERDVHALGVIPFFELLRRENQIQQKNLQLGVLCGSIAIIPTQGKERLLELVSNPSALSFKAIGNLSDQEYVEVDVKGDRHFLTGVMTQLFEEGYMEVLIGTKSLLGEGWDSPCVNSLILASFVGSFMLSNQMRGRAIRTYSKNPDKASNIWHLVCVLPPKINQSETTENGQTSSIDENEDMEMLTRRMENFLGLHYALDTIESGMQRLAAIRYPIENKQNVKKTNEEMLTLSSKREELKARWKKALMVVNEVEVVEAVSVDNKLVTVVGLYDHIRFVILGLIALILTIVFMVPLAAINPILVALCFTTIFGLTFSLLLSCKKIVQFATPLKCLKKFGEGMRQALIDSNQFDSLEHRVETVNDNVVYGVYLIGGSGHDKALFAQCMLEMFKDIDNQRYILYAPRRKRKNDGYFPIPQLFTKRKEDAEAFASTMKKYIGNYTAVYTRNAEGRKILLKGRKYALANRENRAIKRKKVKSALE